jgi:alpha galactosidase C-like protein
MVGSDLTRLSPVTVSLLTNKEALAIHNDPYGLQPIKVDEPTPGIQIWAKPMAIAGRRAVAILNRSDAVTQVTVNWQKLGLKGTPKSLRDVWDRQDLDTVNATVSVPAHDLALMIVDGEDKTPAEYSANQNNIIGIQAKTWAHLCATAVRKYFRSRSSTDGRIRDRHGRPHLAPRNRRPFVR